MVVEVGPLHHILVLPRYCALNDDCQASSSFNFDFLYNRHYSNNLTIGIKETEHRSICSVMVMIIIFCHSFHDNTICVFRKNRVHTTNVMKRKKSLSGGIKVDKRKIPLKL